MPRTSATDTIRILVATDSHVGYMERDAVRGDDGWQSFDEVMKLAKERDVDMVLLAGDLFHENKPSRKSMYKVMESIRSNCFGDKPCELEMLSDASEVFSGTMNHANYEDENLNVAIPVFSIHGNHDDPSGEGHYAAIDLLSMSGLLNYYGMVPESDKIDIKPVLLQKGQTKLALYGMSNVRDERLFRTFRDGKVKFFQPNTQKSDWFNLMSVHQNHHAYTDTGYLPENFLPDFMDLVVWGHEHECLIDPTYNAEMSFHVMQPGSSIATSLMPGEAVPKHVAILSVTGKEFKCETIRLKTVRPFVMREIVLQDDKRMKAAATKNENRTEITKYLVSIVDSMIAEANQSWQEQHEDEDDEEEKPPLPLIRLRVEYTAPEGGRFDIENPQRFSNRFVGRVANLNDVVQFHRKKASASRKAKVEAEMPEEAVVEQMSLDTVKVDKLVREFLAAQNLTILPQNSFGDAVSQFIDKDDKHAVEMFVGESLKSQVSHLLKADELDEDDIADAMDTYKAKLEDLFAKGHLKRTGKVKLKKKPDHWDSDLEGHWEDDPSSRIAHKDDGAMDDDDDADFGSIQPKTKAARGKGKANGTTRSTATAKKTPAAKTNGSRKKKASPVDDEDEDEEQDVVMIDDDDDDDDDEDEAEEEESQGLFVSSKPSTTRKAPARPAAKRAASPPKKKTPARAAATKSSGKQTTLSFSQSQPTTQPRQAPASRMRRVQEPSDDEIDDDDDAFEPPPPTARSTRTRK